MYNIRDKYRTDPEFKYLVDFMTNAIFECKYTPSEMREAAMLACINYEMQHVQSIVIPKEHWDELDKIGLQLEELKEKYER